jgi:prepilin-type processing-associated H-X9-DG protein
VFVHGDGYNVLYADHHVAWYGDPQGTIGYIRLTGANGSRGSPGTTRYSSNNLGNGYLGSYYPNNCQAMFMPYHLFDMAAGVDVNAAQ